MFKIIYFIKIKLSKIKIHHTCTRLGYWRICNKIERCDEIGRGRNNDFFLLTIKTNYIFLSLQYILYAQYLNLTYGTDFFFFK